MFSSNIILYFYSIQFDYPYLEYRNNKRKNNGLLYAVEDEKPSHLNTHSTKSMLTMIAAVGKNNALGKDNDLNISDDLSVSNDSLQAMQL